MMRESPLGQGLGLARTTWGGQASVSSAGIIPVAIQKANDIHQAFLADPTFFWEGGADGCFARAVLMVERILAEGVPSTALGKIAVVHALAPLGGWDMQTRMGARSIWMQ